MTRLFEEFAPVSTEQWMEQVTKDLKGQDFEKRLVTKTEDGIRIRPFYRSEDVPSEVLASGPRRGDSGSWRLREEVRETSPAEANAHALRCLNRGAEELAWLTYPLGAHPASAEDMKALLDGIYMEMVPIHWMSGPLSAHVLALAIGEAERRGLSLDQLEGSVDLDPILDACAEWTTNGLAAWKGEFVPVVKLILEKLPKFKAVTIRGSLIEKAGASHAQQLAFSAALLAEYFQAIATELGPDALKAAAARTEVRLAVGSQYFLEIAKLRAARAVFGQVYKAFGLAGGPVIQAVTTSSTKTLYDPHNNLLRGTLEAMSAVLGGCDSLSVAAYDQGYQTPDEFSEHLARNTDTLLKQESSLAKVADPLGGSYAVEALTHEVGNATWSLFGKVQEEGGFAAAWESGLIPTELTKVKEAKAKAASQRRASIVGTSTYPNPKERRLADVEPRPAARRVKPLAGVAGLGEAGLEALLDSAPIGSSALNAFRPSWPFEHLRLRVERHEAAGGRRPIVQLLLAGDRTMRKARAGFCAGFYGCGGFEVREAVASDWAAAAGLDADLLVLCSSDAEYLDAAKALLGHSPKAPVVVAGSPAEQMDALKEAGVAGFVHIRLDVVDALSSLLSQLGIPEIPMDQPLNPAAEAAR